MADIPLPTFVAYYEKGILKFGYLNALKNSYYQVITEEGILIVFSAARFVLQGREKHPESEPVKGIQAFRKEVYNYAEQFEESAFSFLAEREFTLQEIAEKLKLQDDIQIFALYLYLHNAPDKISCKKDKYRLKTLTESLLYKQKLEKQQEEQQFLQDIDAWLKGADLSKENQHQLYCWLPKLQTDKKPQKLLELISARFPQFNQEEAILQFRKFCGETPEDIDPVIAGAGIPVGFSALLCSEELLPWDKTRPLAKAFCIDDETTRDFDDAIYLTREGSFWKLHLYVSAVAERLNLQGGLFAQAQKRVSSLYTANAVIPLFPFPYSEQEFSLIQNSEHPVLALTIWLDDNYTLQHYEITKMNATIETNFSYQEVDKQITRELFSPLNRMSIELAQKRGANSLTENGRYYYYITATEQGLEAKCVDTQSPARKIVEELMILYNSCLADFSLKHNIPVIYRNISQHTDSNDNTLSLQAYLSTEPEFHPGIGVSAYLHSTSPIRRYVDLVNQMQITAILQGKKPPFSKEELEKDIPCLEKQLQYIKEIAHKSERYWVLKYLQQSWINIPLETYFRKGLNGYLRLELIPWGFIITAKSESYPATERGKVIIYKIDMDKGIAWVDII